MAAAAEIDPAEEGDVRLRTAGMAHHDELLMVRPGPSRTRVQQHLASGLGQLARQLGVLALALVEPAGLRSPDQPEDEDTPSCDVGEHVADRGSGPGEQLLGVAPEVSEVDLVVRPRAAQDFVQAGEVFRTVDQWLDQVPRRPASDVRRRVTALAVAEEPDADTGLVLVWHGGQSGPIAVARPGPEGSGDG